MFVVKYYFLIVLACFSAAFLIPNLVVSLVMGWTGLSVFLVVLAYLFDLPSIFMKSGDGKIAWWIRWAFIPFLAAVRLYNYWSRRNDKVAAIHQIAPHLYVSRRLLRSDLDVLHANGINCIVDVTAEFAGLESAMTDKQFEYLSIPVLDHKVPKYRKLRHALNWIDTQISQSRSVVVHCALGRGRSVFVVAAYLLSQNPDMSVEQVLQQINSVRSSARLNRRQVRALQSMHRKGLLQLDEPAWLIANPVSGGGKWQTFGQRLIRELTRSYRLQLLFTEPDVSATALARQALQHNPDLIIAAGGDGTVGEVAGEVDHSDTRLGIVPFGTANALCHVLYGIGSKTAPIDKACEAILSGNTRQIDTAYCNQQLMLLVMGIGFEQQMIEYAQREEKNQLGQLAYLTGFFNAVMADNPIQLTCRLDDEEPQSLLVRSFVVANTAPFTTLLAQGHGEPEPGDGLLHITYLDQADSVAERLLALSDITLASVGIQDKSELFSYASAQRVEISADKTIDYVVDGELYSADKLTIEIKHQSLQVCVP